MTLLQLDFPGKVILFSQGGKKVLIWHEKAKEERNSKMLGTV